MTNFFSITFWVKFKRSRIKDWKKFWTAFYYCITVACFAGGSGIWLPYFLPIKTVSIDGIASFVMATLAPIGADLIIKSKFNNSTKIWRARVLFFSSFAGVLALCALLLSNQDRYLYGFELKWLLGWMSVLLSLLIWMLVALESDEFDSDESVSGPIGGSQPNVSELSGTGLV